MYDGIDIFWVWLGDLLEISTWIVLGVLLGTALFMIAYTFGDFSRNLNTRKVMEDGPPWGRKPRESESDKQAIEKYKSMRWEV